MSSNIRVFRICKYCGTEFMARTTHTSYCSKKCNSTDYKERLRNEKIGITGKETERIKTKTILDLKTKEFLTVKDVALLLNCSVRSVYNHIDNGNIKAVNLGQRITRVKRDEIDKLFE